MVNGNELEEYAKDRDQLQRQLFTGYLKNGFSEFV